jgi:hypothetical protein
MPATVMNRNTTIDELLREERASSLWNHRVLGYPVWGLQRLSRYWKQHIRGGDESSKDIFPQVHLGRIKSIIFGLRGLWTMLSQPYRCVAKGRDIWVLSSTNYRKLDGNTRKCIFTDLFLKEVSDRVMFLERHLSTTNYQTSDAIFNLEARHYVAMACAKAASWIIIHTPWLVRSLNKKQPNFNIHHELQLALYGHIIEWLTQRWINTARPSAVFVICGYQPFIPLQRVIKRNRIPLIELQHGIIHNSHPGYVYDMDNLPDFIADHIVIFGKYFGERLDQSAHYWTTRWSIGGHGWLNKTRHVQNTQQSEKDYIVIFSQPDRVARDKVRTFARELREILPAEHGIILKPHPREIDSDEYWNDLRRTNLMISSPLDNSYALLSQARVAISVHSTISLEALAFDCLSLVLKTELIPSEFQSLIHAGILVAIETAGDVLKALQVPTSNNPILVNYLFGADEPSLDIDNLIESVRHRIQSTSLQSH